MYFWENPVGSLRENQRTTEEVKFDRAVKRARGLLKKLREGEENFDQVVRAVDRVDDYYRFVGEADREIADELRRQIGPSAEAGREVRITERNRELQRLRDEERERRIGKDPVLRGYLGQNPYLSNPRHDSEILEGLARGPYVIWWADRQEEKGRSLSGVDIYDAAPRTPSRARTWARRVADEIVRLNGKSLRELYDVALGFGYPHDREHFGSDLGLQSTGHGVSWTDDVRPFTREAESAIKLPYSEFYI